MLPPGAGPLELASLATGGMPMEPGMMGMTGEECACASQCVMLSCCHAAFVAGTPMPNQCCTHGAMHCTVPDPVTGMLPPIEPGMAALGGVGGLYDARTPHGGIKQKVGR